MLKEYIDQLEKENLEKQQLYEKEMQEIEVSLSASEKSLEELKKAKSNDLNVFSPRAHNSGADIEISDKQSQIQQLIQRKDHLSEMIKETANHQEEYRALREEINSGSPDGQSPAVQFSSENHLDEDEKVESLVNEVCKKIDFAISLMSGNKNRSRSELKSAERLLRDFVQKDRG